VEGKQSVLRLILICFPNKLCFSDIYVFFELLLNYYDNFFVLLFLCTKYLFSLQKFVKYVRNLMSITAFGDHCVLATKADDSSGQVSSFVQSNNTTEMISTCMYSCS
jgi:hypothetical protein